MSNNLLAELERFMAETGLSPHRVGILVARNGRLVERLREGRPLLTTTEAEAWAGLARERKIRARKASAACAR